ncbi:hypothetical protein MANES_03G147050v8 [Manihot esculenta]|uniref:Uncharacterized protein n=1 Tax=Manihot esculenta TaxID=3983 RepID=A0ACB7I0Z5_MANES|nr:hypothetical protein MANES_03G147050v8 [Manihot esculenta]
MNFFPLIQLCRSKYVWMEYINSFNNHSYYRLIKCVDKNPHPEIVTLLALSTIPFISVPISRRITAWLKQKYGEGN